MVVSLIPLDDRLIARLWEPAGVSFASLAGPRRNFRRLGTLSLRSHYSNSTFAYLIAAAHVTTIRRDPARGEIKHNTAIPGSVMMMTGLLPRG